MISLKSAFFTLCSLFSLATLVLSSALCPLTEAQQTPADNKLLLAYYFPESPVLSPFDVFDNLDLLCIHLSAALPGTPDFEKHIFKKKEDFERFRPRNRIDLLIVDPIYSSQMQDSQWFEPACIMKIDGNITHTKDLTVLSEAHMMNLHDCRASKIALTSSFHDDQLIIKNLFFQNYLDPETYFKSILKVDNADSALLALMYRDADAAIIPSYNAAYKENTDAGKIRILYKTGPMLNGILMVNTQSLEEDAIARIQKSLSNLHLSAEGRQLLAKLKIEQWLVFDNSQMHETMQTRPQPWTKPEKSMAACYLKPSLEFPVKTPNFPEPVPIFYVPSIDPQPVF